MLRPILIASLFAVLLVGCRAGADDSQATPETAESAQEQRRFVENNVFTSTYLPPLRVRIDPAFIYIGHIDFILRDIAQVERYMFVDADRQRHVERTIVFQFEGFLNDNDHTYNYRTTNPVTLGGATYNQNTFFFSNAAAIVQHPEAEMARTTTFLEDHGYTLADELMTSRFVRVVDEARRHEVILFYIENVRATGHTLAEVADDGGIRPQYTAISEGLTRRSLQSMTFLTEPTHTP